MATKTKAVGTRKTKRPTRKPLTESERDRRRIRGLSRRRETAEKRFRDYWDDLFRRFACMDPESERLVAEMDAAHPGADRQTLQPQDDKVAFYRARDEWDAKF